MLRKYNITLTDIPVTDRRKSDLERPVVCLRVEVRYDKGGYIMGREAPRGWSLHVQPMRQKTYSDGETRELYVPTEGVRCFIHEAGRASMRQKNVAAEKAVCQIRPMVEYLINTQGFEVDEDIFANLETHVFAGYFGGDIPTTKQES